MFSSGSSRLLGHSLQVKPSGKYLHSLADLTVADVTQLQRLYVQVTKWLSRLLAVSAGTIQAFVHFPTSALYSTLHVHFGTGDHFLYKELHAVSVNRSVRLEDLIQVLASGTDPLERFHFDVPICVFEELCVPLRPDLRSYFPTSSPGGARVIMFDCDGTLTEEGQHCSEEVIGMLKSLRSQGDVVVVVSGAPFERLQFRFGDNLFRLFHLVCAEGGLDTRTPTQSFQVPLEEYLSAAQHETFLSAVSDFISDHAIPARFPQGDIETRRCMVNVALMDRGRTDLFADFHAWDMATHYRKQLLSFLRQSLPELPFQYQLGSHATFDCTIHPKSFALRFFRPPMDTIWFFGDRCAPGGNDYQLYQRCLPHAHSTNGPKNTVRLVEELLLRAQRQQ